MDIDYKTVIDFSNLKKIVDEKGFRYSFIAKKAGLRGDVLGRIFRNEVFPKTDLTAKLAFILDVPVSEIVFFKLDENKKKMTWFAEKELPYSPDGEVKGEVTYEPLRIMMDMYLDYLYANAGKEKTINDLFDLIEPYRRRNGLSPFLNNAVEASLRSRYGEGYKSARTDRKYKAKGLTPQTRLKLKNDRPLNIRAIYDICNFFGCSVDWVMSYK